MALWVSEGHQPLQCRMICPDSEGPATQVVLEVLNRRHHGEELSARDAVAALSLVEGFAEIRHHSLPLWPRLSPHCTHAQVAGICVQSKL